MLSQSQIHELERSILQDSYYDFFIEFWDTVIHEEYVENWHIKFLCEELEKVGRLVIERKPKEYDLVINISPGESKSTICTVLFPVWLWANDPTLRVISGSYTASLAIEHSALSRDCVRSDKFQRLFGNSVQLRQDVDAKTFYKTTAGGIRQAVSTGGAVTGSHAHILLVDDPINPKMAVSAPMLEGANEWLTKTLSSRKVDKANTPTILIMQRLHESDPTSIYLDKIKDGKNVRHICLPAENTYPIEPPECEEFYEDGIMNPKRTGRAVLADAKIDLGTLEYAGQYGQQPTAVEGGKIKAEWWRYCDENQIPPGIIWDMWIDGAYTKNTANDPTGIMICGHYKPDNVLYIVYGYEGYLEMPELLKKVKEICDTERWMTYKSRVYVEPAASGKSLKQMLFSTSKLSVIEIKSSLVQEGKEARIQATSPRAEAGRLILLNRTWAGVIVHQNKVFPKGKHDEFVDLVGYASEHYFGKPKRKGVRRRN